MLSTSLWISSSSATSARPFFFFTVQTDWTKQWVNVTARPLTGGNAAWARAYMTHTHQGQMLIQERASGTVTAHHWKLRICRRRLHTVSLLFIYLAVCAGVCGVMSCAVVGECCISLISRHTPQIQIPLMCYSSHNPHNFTMNFEVPKSLYDILWHCLCIYGLGPFFNSFNFFLLLLLYCRWQSNPTLIR